jgi:hypothetical protein
MRDDNYTPFAKTPPPRVATPEPIWTLRRGVDTASCRLLCHGEHGWECQVFRNGEFRYGQRWLLHADALAHADAERRDYQREGYTVDVPSD